MMLRLALIGLLAGSIGFGQLAMEQKVADFRHLAGLYAKQYAPYEWKLAVERFDLLDLGGWLDRVRATRNDLDFYDLMIEYVARLNDAHDVYTLPSNFSATLGFTVDIYDGKVLIDSINPTRLPASEYPFQIGDELVSVDGRDVESLIAELSKYSVAANPRSTRRSAAGRITTRSQNRIPRAIEVGDRAEAVIRRAGGDLETYSLPWIKTGLAMTMVGPAPTPQNRRMTADAASVVPDYLAPLVELQNCELPEKAAVLGQGSRIPIFAMPAEFHERLGRSPSDAFFSGTFQAQGFRIGLIRIPNYSPADAAAALAQFRREMAHFQQHTDGLIVDQMRNPGGGVAYTNSLLQYLMPFPFRALGFEIRATSNWVTRFSSALESARSRGAEPWIVRLYEAILQDVVAANRENRGRTGPLPLDDVSLEREPARDAGGALLAYTKPLMVLADEFSASGGDAFPATIQDNRRGPIFGMRTMGAGGSVVTLGVGSYSEGSAGMTQTLMNRKYPIATSEYPAAPYVENIGVRPDIEADYMTRDNLLNGGRAFVQAFTEAMADHIRKNGDPIRP
jgi:hypothetical protein